MIWWKASALVGECSYHSLQACSDSLASGMSFIVTSAICSSGSDFGCGSSVEEGVSTTILSSDSVSACADSANAAGVAGSLALSGWGVESSLMGSMLMLFKLSGVPTSSGGQVETGELTLLWGEIAGVGGADFRPLFQYCSRYSGVYDPPYSVATFPHNTLFCISNIF